MQLSNSNYRLALGCLAVTATLLASRLALAQTTPALTATSAPAQTQAAHQNPDQRTERIHIEDNSAVIDEVRIGGATKSIDVKPKGGMPAYQVAPDSGERSWKVLGF